jgi:hypothetical protein
MPQDLVPMSGAEEEGGLQPGAANAPATHFPVEKWEAKEFKVTFQKGAKGTSAGLELDLLGLQFAQVCAVLPSGLVKAYNDDAESDLKVRVGDFIVAVNEARGDMRRMIERFEEDSRIEMTITRPVPFTVTLSQKPGALLSSLKCAATGVSLLVVRTHSTIASWNDTYPDRAVKNHDCIVAVNGVKGDTKQMMEQVERAAELELQIARPGAA